MKKVFYSEWAYVFGIVFLAVATAFTKQADLGLSMVVAPAYILHLLLSPIFPFVTFGTATYLFQGLLLVATCIVIRRFRVSYLFSFVTAVIYGFLLDGAVLLVSLIPADHLAVRIAMFGVGTVVCALANGIMIAAFSRFLDKRFEFRPRFKKLEKLMNI